mmetsp:Transcript_35286/g.87625  ORF Transcript_35286/g.87625 Transcript_35286/m.87625 type:complete len:128 (-) Transcript_35286:1759-2142(-)
MCLREVPECHLACLSVCLFPSIPLLSVCLSCLSVCLSASKLPVCLSDLHNLTCAHLCGQPTHSHATYSTHASHPHREESSTQPSMRCHVSQPGYPSPFLAASQTDELRLTHPSRPQRESSSKSIYSA